MILNRTMLTGSLCFVLLFIFMEVFVASFIPAMISTFHLPQFMPMFIIYLGVKWDSPYRPIYILILNLIHATFSTEGWAIGTFLGVLLAMPLSSLREIIHFNSNLVLTIFSFFFHLVWFFLGTIIFAMKNDNYELIKLYSMPILFKSLFLSFCTPVIFKILERFWLNSNGNEKGLNHV